MRWYGLGAASKRRGLRGRESAGGYLALRHSQLASRGWVGSLSTGQSLRVRQEAPWELHRPTVASQTALLAGQSESVWQGSLHTQGIRVPPAAKDGTQPQPPSEDEPGTQPASGWGD